MQARFCPICLEDHPENRECDDAESRVVWRGNRIADLEAKLAASEARISDCAAIQTEMIRERGRLENKLAAALARAESLKKALRKEG